MFPSPLTGEWPTTSSPVDTVIRDRELANRDLTDGGLTRVSMVPLTVAGLKEFTAETGADPTDETTRRACTDQIVEEDGTISWPPPRNSPCWCGSSVKYREMLRPPHLT